jgi:hypothetical protein
MKILQSTVRKKEDKPSGETVGSVSQVSQLVNQEGVESEARLA